MKNAFLTKTLVGVCALGFALANPASAADPATHPLSRDHVNLVRVQGQKITDVVYDTQVLEVSADKQRGIVFVKVKSAWLNSAAENVTSAFFNTETENFSVQFFVSAVPSQTVDLVPQTDVAGAEDDRRFASLPAPEGAAYWEGFKVRETRAFLSADKLTETLLFTRVSPKASVPDAARLAGVIRGVLAVAQEVRTGDRLQTEVTIIR